MTASPLRTSSATLPKREREESRVAACDAELVRSGEAGTMVEEGDCPDVLLLDLNMPRMAGYAVIPRLRAS